MTKSILIAGASCAGPCLTKWTKGAVAVRPGLLEEFCTRKTAGIQV